MDYLKVQHLIVLIALLVSLVGTLLILEKMNADAGHATGRTTQITTNVAMHVTKTEQEQQQSADIIVRIIGGNETEEE